MHHHPAAILKRAVCLFQKQATSIGAHRVQDRRQEHHVVSLAEVVHEVVPGASGYPVPEAGLLDDPLGPLYGLRKIEDDRAQAGVASQQEYGVGADPAAAIE